MLDATQQAKIEDSSCQITNLQAAGRTITVRKMYSEVRKIPSNINLNSKLYCLLQHCFIRRGTLTGQRYVDDILRPHVGPLLNGLPAAIFQQGNAHPHTARVAQDFLRHFQTLTWPVRSPDLSPVEHVWDQLKWQMPSCHSVHDLELAVQDLWAHLPQDSIRCLNSMPDRAAACVTAGGHPTQY
ncbi:transposable element Tcb2 transposase [Trichonephila clavipes]|nr:transposable element Tcb2 transposase [Trichonephila clavipes]